MDTQDKHYIWITCIEIASKAHDGQKRLFSGEPYFAHPYRVMHKLMQITDDVDVIAAGLLHDVVEDSEYTFESLLEEGVRPETIRLLRILSRDTQTYPDYITEICKDEQAKIIKSIDICDNLSTLPIGHPLAARYIDALQRIHLPYEVTESA